MDDIVSKRQSEIDDAMQKAGVSASAAADDGAGDGIDPIDSEKGGEKVQFDMDGIEVRVCEVQLACVFLTVAPVHSNWASWARAPLGLSEWCATRTRYVLLPIVVKQWGSNRCSVACRSTR